MILVGHVKDKALNEAGTELNVKDLDLTGKLVESSVLIVMQFAMFIEILKQEL